MTPNHHWNGQGCPKCNVGSWSRTKFISRCGEENGLLYVVKLYDEFEEFIKIGITSNSVRCRFQSLNEYEIDSLYECMFYSGDVWDLEKYLHKQLKQYKYIPLIKFGGCTECFTMNALPEIEKLLQIKKF